MAGVLLRVTHTGLAGDSLILSDLAATDDGEGKFRAAGPPYVPVNSFVDLVYDTNVSRSYTEGVIRGFINGGHVTAQLVAEDDYQEAVGTRIDKIVRVAAKAIQGDYTSIKAACDAETTAGTLILVMPGTYEEDPFTVAPDVHLDVWGIDVVTIGAKAAHPNTDLVTLQNRASVRQVSITCPTNAFGIVVDGAAIQGLIESVVFLSGYGGARAINGGDIYMRHGLITAGLLHGLRAEAGSFAGFHGTVDRASTRSLEAIGVGSFAIFSSIAVEDCGDAFYVEGGGRIQGQGAAVNGIISALVHTGPGGGIVDIGGVSRTHTAPAALDVRQDDASGFIILRGVTLDAERLSAVDYSKITGYGNRSGAGINAALTVWSALHVGTPGVGRELVAGQGDVTTLGVRAFTYDGANFVDVSTAAITTGSPITIFPNVNANTAFYVGWQLDGGFQFHGLEFETISQILTLGGGVVTAEYWNGAWTAFNFMVTDEASPFLPQAMDIWRILNGSEHVRFDETIMASWVANDPIIPAVGADLYWIRFRISTGPITQSPIVDLIKMVPTRTRFDENGLREMDGIARVTSTLPWALGEFGKVVGFGTAPNDQNIWVSQNIAVPKVENNFRAGFDSRVTRSGTLPTNTDTSSPVRVVWRWVPSTAAAGNVEWTITWTYVPHGFVYGFVNPGAPHPNEKTISVVTAVPGVARQAVDSVFTLDISGLRARVVGGHGDILFVSVKRAAGAGLDSYGGDAVVVDIDATHLAYMDGI